MLVFSLYPIGCDYVVNILLMGTMGQYRLNDLMNATKEEVGKEAVKILLPAVVQEAGSFLFE